MPQLVFARSQITEERAAVEKPAPPLDHRVQALAEQVRQLETARFAEAEVVSSGSPALDGLLPEGGFRRGALVEWLSAGAGSGMGTLALVAARQALAAGGALVVIDRRRQFYPLAAAQWGIPLERLILVRPGDDEEQAWALDQALRSRGVAAAWCDVGRTDEHTLRRWQLAAESSGVLGFLFRAARARREPSWAELRLWVEPQASLLPTSPAPSSPSRTSSSRASPQVNRTRTLRVELLRTRVGRAGGSVVLKLADQPSAFKDSIWRGPHETRSVETCSVETRSVHLAPQLAPAKARRRSRRA